MSTNTSEQHQPAARQMMSIEDVVEVAPYEPWSQPRTMAAAQIMGIKDAEDATEVASYEPRNEPNGIDDTFDHYLVDLDDIMNIDNSEFPDDYIHIAHRVLVERLNTNQAILNQLRHDTALSVKELEHEIAVASRGVTYRETLLERYNQGWRAKLQRLT